MVNITIEGYISDIAFKITGPPHKVDAIRNFIRNLTHMYGGLHLTRDRHRDIDKMKTE